ncbi:MAG TPA: choice-of-anchor L domain-containing protein [Flavobacteriales bacterium]|nr:choice-of-anchor L domain-containing protein [Flavobacteriales bacterium]
MKFIALLVLVMGYSFAVGQNIAVNNAGVNSNPVYLAQNVLSGGGMNVYNVTYSGSNAQQIGYYSSGTGVIGSNTGIAISTGNVLNIANSNFATNTGTNIGTTGTTDPDVLQLANGQTAKDWFILEFDFVPKGNQVNMQYVFASEEYNEYVCSNVADVFGIIISGPGFSGSFSGGGKQVSLIPSTTNPVGINSVNNGLTGSMGTPGGCISTTNTAYYNDNVDSLMEFDGYTDVMSISETVECEQQYHMRIIIFDCGTKQYDSGIFLTEKSLTSNGSATYDNPVYNDSIIVEGCKPYEFVIYNVDGFTSQTINLSISGSAQNGIDYTPIANTITLPAGDNFYGIVITPVADGVTEGTETVVIAFDMINLCGDTSHFEFTIYIQDENPLVVTSFPTSISICSGTPVNLFANVSGGIAPYHMEWNGMLGNNLWVVPTETTTYTAAFYDQAGCPWYNNFTVTVYPVPIVNAGGDFSICMGQQQTLGLYIDGGPGATYTWTPAFQLNSASFAYPTISPLALGAQTYTVTVSNPGGCSVSDAVTVTVLALPTINAGPDQNIVYLQTSEELQGSGSGTPWWTPNFNLSCENCFTPDASPTQTTTYTLTITGTNGCTATDQVDVIVETPTDVFVPSAFSPNGDGNNDVLFLRCYTIASVKFKVYDMWGQPMFETSNAEVGWDGTVNGNLAGIGLYTWTADVTFVNNAGSVSLGGEVNLVR